MLVGQARVVCVGKALSKKLRYEVVVTTEDEMGGGVENGPSAAQQTGHAKRAKHQPLVHNAGVGNCGGTRREC